ncbi:hypothetical protein FRB91_010551 [Serendipita sp. 411]|nr:hypothetical protein FRB91_010551 [Serendipita sp. 411]
MAIESLSRAYQASWMALTTVIGSKTGETQYDVAITSSKAVVTLWRLYAWLALHCCVLLFGLFFAYLQSKCQHPWVDNPAFSTLLLNNGHIFTPDIWMTSDPWDRDVTLPKGLIRLEDAGSSARRMEMDDSAHELLEPDHLEEDTEKEVV